VFCAIGDFWDSSETELYPNDVNILYVFFYIVSIHTASRVYSGRAYVHTANNLRLWLSKLTSSRSGSVVSVPTIAAGDPGFK